MEPPTLIVSQLLCEINAKEQLLLGLAPALRVYAIQSAGAYPGQATIQNTSTPWIRIKPHTRHLSWMVQCGIKTKHRAGDKWITLTNNLGEASDSNSDTTDGYPLKSAQNRNRFNLLWRPVSSYAGFKFDQFPNTFIFQAYYTLTVTPLPWMAKRTNGHIKVCKVWLCPTGSH